MATLTGGTKTTSNLTALQFPSFAAGAMSDADIATIANAIINDQSPPAILPGAFSRMGLLYVPNRGILKVLPGDFVMVGPEGWPILVSDIACPFALTLTGTPVSGSASMVVTTSALAAGWQLGSQVTGSGIAASTVINNISADGLTITLSKVATSSPGAVTITNGSFTHS